MSSVAETECQEKRKRQAEGIAEVKEKGVKFGRPELEKPENFLSVCEEYWNDELNVTETARKLDVSRSTFKEWYDECFLESNCK